MTVAVWVEGLEVKTRTFLKKCIVVTTSCFR